MKDLTLTSLLSIAVLLCFFGCDAWEDDTQLNNSKLDKGLNELLAGSPEISIFTQILQLTGYDKYLQEEPSLTVFAPRNSVLEQMDLSDVDGLKEWVQNYIAYLSHYTDASGNFAAEGNVIEMLNGKSVTVYPSFIEESNIACANGVLHILNDMLEYRKSIWDYLLGQQPGYEQVQFIRSFEEKVMDMDRSVQTGVNASGQPVYDTIWTIRNTFLDAYPLSDERHSFTVVLVEENALNALKTKYAKYMVRKNATEQNNVVMTQLAGDLILEYTVIDRPGRYLSLADSVWVDIDPANIVESYKASNGMVYKLSTADVKMYRNKIKEQIIEGENYVEAFDNSSAWITRYRSGASGGQDVVLMGRTRQTFTWETYYPGNDSTAVKTGSSTFTYSTNNSTTYIQSNTINAYVKYQPTLYSCAYNIFWKTYDDFSNHVYTISEPDTVVVTSPENLVIPMKLAQKLMISFPGEPALVREADGSIGNNFAVYTFMAGETNAAEDKETQVVRYRKNADSNPGYFMITADATQEIWTGTDEFGQGGTLICPAQGKATFFVANTVRTATPADAGLVFLDYIRLVPLVDPND